MNKSRKKASYGKMNKMRGGNYMEPDKEIKFGNGGKKPRKRAQGSAEFRVDAKSNQLADDFRKGETSSVRTDSKGNQTYTQAAVVSSSSKKSSNNKGKEEYKKAKAANSNLDALTRERNRLRDAGKKGSAEYNAVQNKINKAYGKGPTNRPTNKSGFEGQSTTSGRPGVGRPTNQSAEQGKNPNRTKPATSVKSLGPAQVPTGKPSSESIKTLTPLTPPSTKTKPTTEAGKAAKAKQDEKTKKLKDRRNKADRRKEGREAKDLVTQRRKDAGATGKQARVAGRLAKAGVKGKIKKFDNLYDKATNVNRRVRERGEKAKGKAEAKQISKEGRQERKEMRKAKRGTMMKGRKKAQGGLFNNLLGANPLAGAGAGAATGAANAISQGIQQGDSFGNIAKNTLKEGVKGAVGSIPIVGGALSGLLGGKNKDAAAPAAPAAGGATGAPAANPMMPDAATANVEQQTNMPMRKGGKRRKKRLTGGESIKAGIDKNPKITHADKAAKAGAKGKMPDRRKRGGSR